MTERRRRWLGWRAAALIAALLTLTPLLLQLRKAPAPAPSLLIVLSAGAGGEGASEPSRAGAAIGRLPVSFETAQPELLLDGFVQVGVPRVSYDGQRVLFAGRREAGEPMSIWEVPLGGSRPRRVASDSDGSDPAYLPDGRIVYARASPGGGSALHACRTDGTEDRPITFGRVRDRAPAVLPDGRIVFRRHDADGEAPGRLFTVNPDGSGFALFRGPSQGTSIEAGPWVLDERVIFAEQAGESQRLLSISARRPLDDAEPLGALEGGELSRARYSSLSRLPGGTVLAAVDRGEGTSRWLAIGPAPSSASDRASLSLVADRLNDSLRPIALTLASARRRPLALTSVVDESRSTGTLLCLSIFDSSLPEISRARGEPLSVRLRGADGTVLGDAPIETDGSFFIEVPADRPLALEVVGAAGVIASQRTHFWVRPNESRACIGCHEDPELAPENRVPLAIGRAPTPIGAVLAGAAPVRAAGDPTSRAAIIPEARPAARGAPPAGTDGAARAAAPEPAGSDSTSRTAAAPEGGRVAPARGASAASRDRGPNASAPLSVAGGRASRGSLSEEPAAASSEVGSVGPPRTGSAASSRPGPERPQPSTAGDPGPLERRIP